MAQKYKTFFENKRKLSKKCNLSPKYFDNHPKMSKFAPAYQSGKHPMSSRPLEMEM